MTGSKDSDEIIKFMALFHKLKDWIDDDPECLIDLAADDDSIKELCQEVSSAEISLLIKERHRRNIFAAPVDPKFIAVWRDLEDRYRRPLAHIWLVDLSLVSEERETTQRPSTSVAASDLKWDFADIEAKDQADAIERVIDLAEQETENDREWPEDYQELIVGGLVAWARLKTECGLDLRGIFRRRELIPFIHIPRHVAHEHGSGEKLSLYQLLRQAHDAYMFGAPFAAIALMRSIMETVLKKHYGAQGSDLKVRIDNCRKLPRGASKGALHRLRRLANDILHFNKEAKLPMNLEKEILSLLLVLRELIEGVPKWPSR